MVRFLAACFCILLGACTDQVSPTTTSGSADTDQPTCLDDPAACDTALCDPLFQDCDPGEGCYPVGSGFDCAPTTDTQRIGEPCQVGPECLPGTLCAQGDAVPNCASIGCCTEFCDLADGSSSCKLAADGSECVPFYAPEDAPPGLESLGVCLLAGASP